MEDFRYVRQVQAQNPSWWRRAFIYLWRVTRLKCPLCGLKPIFIPWYRVRNLRDWFTPLDGCPNCGYAYDREPGYFLMSIWAIDYGFSAVLGLFVYLACEIFGHLTTPQIMVATIAPVVVFSVIFARHAKAYFLAIDHYCDPHIQDGDDDDLPPDDEGRGNQPLRPVPATPARPAGAGGGKRRRASRPVRERGGPCARGGFRPARTRPRHAAKRAVAQINRLPASFPVPTFRSLLVVLVRWLPALIWMVLIFLGSTDALSASHTSRFIEPLLRWLFRGISQTRVDEIHFLIRKTGHVCEYALLALLFYWALRPWTRKAAADEQRGVSGGGTSTVVIALLLAVAYAAGDEFHQSFVSSRGASVHDVMIDAMGAALGLSVVWAWTRYRSNGPARQMQKAVGD